MAQYEHEGPCDTISYSSQEIHRAGQALNKDVARGDLQFLQSVFEYYPLEAVPNVWEGDEGMMEHVLDFPVPPCIALPEQLVSEAADSIPRVCRNKRPRPAIYEDDDDDSIPIVPRSKRPKPKTRSDGSLGVKLILTKKCEMKKKFWVNLVRVYESLGSIENTLLWKVITNFASEEKDMKTACFVLNRLYGYLKKIKSALDNAEAIYNEGNYSDMFQQMTPSRRLKFMKQNAFQGEFPDSIASIVEKFTEVRNQMREFVSKNWTQMAPFHKLLQGLMKCIRRKRLVFSKEKIFSGANVLPVDGDGVDEQLVCGAASDIPGCGEEQGGRGHSKNRKSEHVGDTQVSNGLYKEEEFWKNVVHLKTLAQQISVTLSLINDVNIPNLSKLSVKRGSDICRQMFLARKNIVTINKTLLRLKEQMKTNNYEDKTPFSTDDLICQGIDVTPDNSLGVIEVMLNTLQEHYLRVQDDNFSVLQKIGYGWKVGFKKFVGNNIVLVRICAHSKTKLKTPGFNRIAKRQSKILHTQNDPGQDSEKIHVVEETGDDGSQKPVVEETGDNGSQKPVVEETGDNGSQKPVVEETGDDGSDEDYSDISKTVNSLSFFMSNLEPGALTVSAPSVAPAIEEFIERVDSKILHTQNDPRQDSQKIPDGDYGSQKPDVEETGDDGSDEDYSDISKTVNSLSFFMSNLEPGALTVSAPSVTPATEEFIEQEKQYWDRLQTLLLKINRVFYKIEEKCSKSNVRKFHMKNSLQVLHQSIKELFSIYQSERDQGCRAGYCMHVTYQAQGQMPDSYEDTLVKNIDQIKDRIYAAYKLYTKAAKTAGIPFSYKLC